MIHITSSKKYKSNSSISSSSSKSFKSDTSSMEKTLLILNLVIVTLRRDLLLILKGTKILAIQLDQQAILSRNLVLFAELSSRIEKLEQNRTTKFIKVK